MARVKALLRYSAYGTQREFTTPAIELDANCHQVQLNGIKLNLTRVELSLPQTLLNAPERVYWRQQLMDHIYHDYRAVSGRTIDTHIKNLRYKMARAAPGCGFIEPLYGVGYRYSP